MVINVLYSANVCEIVVVEEADFVGFGGGSMDCEIVWQHTHALLAPRHPRAQTVTACQAHSWSQQQARKQSHVQKRHPGDPGCPHGRSKNRSIIQAVLLQDPKVRFGYARFADLHVFMRHIWHGAITPPAHGCLSMQHYAMLYTVQPQCIEKKTIAPTSRGVP